MPRSKRVLDWFSPRKCWRGRKMIKGTRHVKYFKHPKNQAGYKRALEEWKLFLAKLEIQKQTEFEAWEYIRLKRQLARFAELEGNLDVMDAVEKEIEALRDPATRTETLTQQIYNQFPFDPEVLQQQLLVAKHEEWQGNEAPPDEKRFSPIIEAYVRSKKPDISGKQLNAITAQLHHFRVWVEAKGVQSIDDIKGRHLTDYRSHVLDMADDGMIAQTTAQRRMGIVKSFLEWAYENEYMVILPKNIKSKSLVITSPDFVPNPYTMGEIERIWKATTNERTRLFILLSLNCGMLPADISDILQKEFDETAGTITRQRTKTRKKHSKTVPTVTYKLWPMTLKLMKKYGSPDSPTVLADEDGSPLCYDWEEDGKYKERNAIRDAYRYVVDNLDPPIDGKSFKSLRATGATVLETHDVFGQAGQTYLGQVPHSIKDKHYAATAKAKFDRACVWLGEQFTFLNAEEVEKTDHR